MKVAIQTLGCKANQYDSFAIEGLLRDNSLKIVPFSAPADAYIINTCTVTSIADYKSRYLIRKAQKSNPSAVIIVTGCYAQVSYSDVEKIDGVDFIMGNAEKDSILNMIYEGKQAQPKVIVDSTKKDKPLNLLARDSSNNTRAYLKIQDGCDRYCSYCIIPSARGKSRSLSFDDVIREIEALIQNNYKEIVLTGIHLGSYKGFDAEDNLTKLIKEIVKKDYLCRFRISSLDTDEVTDELIETIASSKSICNHIHLSIQSLDDEILKRMNRPHYTNKTIIDKVRKIHGNIKDVSIGADIIAGFPGETDLQFMNTYNTIEDLPLTYLHVFPFSKRKGTAADVLDCQVDSKSKVYRCGLLKKLSEKKRETFYTTQIGKYMDVLVESLTEKGMDMAKGKSRNYIPVVFECKDNIINKEVKVLLKEKRGKGVFGIYGV